MTDEELVRFCRAGDSAACNVLFEKYKPLVKSRAANKYLSGGEYDDLIQEGMIGLLAAVNDYDPVKAEGAKFGTFATLCIDRQLMHAIESARSRKNRVLSESVPMDAGDMDKVLTAAFHMFHLATPLRAGKSNKQECNGKEQQQNFSQAPPRRNARRELRKHRERHKACRQFFTAMVSIHKQKRK